MYPPPPRLDANGSTTPRANDTTTAASTAFKPSSRASLPALAASSCAATTIPVFDFATFIPSSPVFSYLLPSSLSSLLFSIFCHLLYLVPIFSHLHTFPCYDLSQVL